MQYKVCLLKLVPTNLNHLYHDIHPSIDLEPLETREVCEGPHFSGAPNHHLLFNSSIKCKRILFKSPSKLCTAKFLFHTVDKDAVTSHLIGRFWPASFRAVSDCQRGGTTHSRPLRGPSLCKKVLSAKLNRVSTMVRTGCVHVGVSVPLSKHTVALS